VGSLPLLLPFLAFGDLLQIKVLPIVQEKKSIYLAMAARALLLASLVLSCFLLPACYGTVLFSSLQRTLEVTASPTSGQGNTIRMASFSFLSVLDFQLLSSTFRFKVVFPP
jgi:hypothetical protein